MRHVDPTLYAQDSQINQSEGLRPIPGMVLTVLISGTKPWWNKSVQFV